MSDLSCIEISEVEIAPIKPREGLVAFASLVLNNAIYLGSIGVYSKRDGSGYRLTFPTRKVGDREINVYHPISRASSQKIEDAIFARVRELLEL